MAPSALDHGSVILWLCGNSLISSCVLISIRMDLKIEACSFVWRTRKKMYITHLFHREVIK